MHYLDEEDRLATPEDSMWEYAKNVGQVQPWKAWILTDYDVWMPNSYYRGPKVRHPEEHLDDYGGD
jgi:hypothetical protein